MTREEFTERVGLNVSDGIFEVWNGVYMSSDKDKDEFCKPFATKKGHLDLSRSMVIEIAELKKKIRVQKESYDRQVELATSYQVRISITRKRPSTMSFTRNMRKSAKSDRSRKKARTDNKPNQRIIMDKTRQAKAESLHEWKSQMADFLLERAQKFGDITLHIKAADLIGMKEVIRRKIIKGLPLWEVDRVWLKNNLK